MSRFLYHLLSIQFQKLFHRKGKIKEFKVFDKSILTIVRVDCQEYL